MHHADPDQGCARLRHASTARGQSQTHSSRSQRGAPHNASPAPHPKANDASRAQHRPQVRLVETNRALVAVLTNAEPQATHTPHTTRSLKRSRGNGGGPSSSTPRICHSETTTAQKSRVQGSAGRVPSARRIRRRTPHQTSLARRLSLRRTPTATRQTSPNSLFKNSSANSNP